MHAHAAAELALVRLAKGRGEARALAGLFHGVALLLGGHAEARERLRGVERRVLGEVHDVDGGVAVAQGQLDGGLERGVHVLVGEGHRALGLGDLVDRAAGLAPERRADSARVAQGGAHEQKLRVGQGQERHLPGPAAVGLAKEVELVHGDGGHVARGPLAQGLVGEDLLRAADDGSVCVDVGVSGDHAHVVAAEDLHQVKELLGDEGLDGSGVVGAPVLADGHVGEAERDHRLARARGRAQDHVVAGGQVEQRLLLVGPELHAAPGAPVEVALEGRLGVEGRLGGVVGPLLGVKPEVWHELAKRAGSGWADGIGVGGGLGGVFVHGVRPLSCGDGVGIHLTVPDAALLMPRHR